MSVVPIKSEALDAAEVSWFSALCSDDYEYLGVPDPALKSSWTHCRDILLEAEKNLFLLRNERKKRVLLLKKEMLDAKHSTQKI